MNTNRNRQITTPSLLTFSIPSLLSFMNPMQLPLVLRFGTLFAPVMLLLLLHSSGSDLVWNDCGFLFLFLHESGSFSCWTLSFEPNCCGCYGVLTESDSDLKLGDGFRFVVGNLRFCVVGMEENEMSCWKKNEMNLLEEKRNEDVIVSRGKGWKCLKVMVMIQHCVGVSEQKKHMKVYNLVQIERSMMMTLLCWCCLWWLILKENSVMEMWFGS